MAVRSAELIIRLIDQVSGPARGIANRVREIGIAARTVSGSREHMKAVEQDLGRVRRGFSAFARPIAPLVGGLGLYKLHTDVLEFSKATNKLAAANPEATADQIQRIKDLSREISRTTLFDPATVMNAANALARADVSVDAIAGTLKPLADAAMASDVPVSELAEDFVGLANAFGLSLKNAADAKQTFATLGDMAVYVAQRAPGSFTDYVQAMKQIGPAAKTLGVDIKWLAGAYIMLDKAGIRNVEAGVALKSMLNKIVQPTAAARGMMAQLGIDPSEFTKQSGVVTSDQLVRRIAAEYGKSLKGIGPKLQAVLDAGGTQEELQTGLMGVIEGAWGKMRPVDARKLSKTVSKFLSSGVAGIDPQAWLDALAKRNVTFGQFLQMVEPRQAQKLSALAAKMGEEGEAARKALETPVTQMLGLRPGLAGEAASKMMQGYPAAIAKMSAAWHTFIEALDKGGVIDKVASGMQSLAESITKVIQGGASMGDWVTSLSAGLPVLLPLLGSAGAVLTGIASAARLIGATGLLGAGVAGAVVGGGGILATLGILGAAGAGAYGLVKLWNYLDGTDAKAAGAGATAGSGDANKRVADAFSDLNKSNDAATAGQQTGQAYATSLMAQLKQLDAQVAGIVNGLVSKLSFEAHPTITPRIAPAPASAPAGKQARNDGLYDFYPHTA